jgi:hypothetical protein
MPAATALAGRVLRISTAAAMLALFAGYVAWLCGFSEFAKRIWMPFAWLVRHPPDPTLAILLGALALTVLFFEPIYRFATNVREAFGLSARGEPPTSTGPRDPNPGGPPEA